MSVSKTNFFQGIALLLKEMSKTFTDLSKKTETNQQKIQKIEEQLEIVIQQHLDIIKQIKMVSMLQSDIANQVVKQHEDLETLYIALGLKKDLSYYSFNIMDAEEH